jgi:CHAD domain-containing protein
MTDETPKTDQGASNDILDELREMGKNLRDALQSAWDSEERRKLQKEIEEGLSEVSTSLSQAAKDFKESSAGQTLKSDVADFQERLRTGEVESKVRSEIVDALRIVNTELRKVGKKDS